MLPAPQPALQASTCRLPALRMGALALALACTGWTGSTTARAAEDTASTSEERREIAFEANELSYDSDNEIVRAEGNVILRSGDQSVRADRVVWDRRANMVTAVGSIRYVDGDGNVLFADDLTLTDDLRLGAMQNMLLALREGGRIAAREGSRGEDGNVELAYASYSACAVEDESGCPKTPSWRIVAERVIYDPDANRVRFRGAQLEVFGQRLLPLPGLKLATDGKPISGLTVPDLRVSASNGLEISEGYYLSLAPNQDLTVTGYIYTEAPPMFSARYRALVSEGAFQLTGYLTRSARIAIGDDPGTQESDWRGYFAANSKFQFSPEWSLTASARIASDRTFLRRYDISHDDRLRSTFNLERIDSDSYFSISGWATQTLRTGDPQGQVPIALPLLDYRRRIDDPWLGGRFELQFNTLAITRTEGQDTQRAFASAKWDLRTITGMGQEVTFTALVRGDAYHSTQNDLTDTLTYRGNPGWEFRGVATGAVDVKWPFVGELFGGTQVLTPRVQIVASPQIKNLAVPNEDARAIDLEDSNLFALNRFPGYDRIEDGVRFTYGLDWQFAAKGIAIKTTFGQSYRLTSDATLLPDGTGLSERVSDWVGRTEVKFRDFVKLTHRFRLDKDNLAVRRNEIDATVGSSQTYLEVGYLRLNRDISADFEDLQDREALRAAGRVAINNRWSIFGAAVVNLTDANENPADTSDGFQPLRTRLGFAYADDCLELGLTWRRDFVESGDAREGSIVQVHVVFKNLGF